MSSGAVNFRGYVGRLGRRVTTVDGVIECRVGKEEVQAHRPTADAWVRFWDVAEGLGVWRWGAEYGREIRDGRPWWLELQSGERRLATTGNDYEEHAPAGVRSLVLAIDALVVGRLLQVEDVRALRKNFKVKVMVTKESRPPISELVLLRRLFEGVEQAVAWTVHCYTLGASRDGASFLLDEPPGPAALAAVRGCLAGREPVLSLVEFSTGREVVL